MLVVQLLCLIAIGPSALAVCMFKGLPRIAFAEISFFKQAMASILFSAPEHASNYGGT
jgi:hypothetical protein